MLRRLNAVSLKVVLDLIPLTAGMATSVRLALPGVKRRTDGWTLRRGLLGIAEAGRRGFDVLFALCGLVIASLPMLLIALGVRLSSPGPVLFRQQRVGRGGRLFSMYKFRSMQVAPEVLCDRQWSGESALRCTGFGGWLRRTGLDELPQLVNVLCGEMSAVGPRPERPYFVARFRREIAGYGERHRVRPGITGWAQVCGLRGDTDIARRVELDLEYIARRSPWFDLRVLAMTVPVLLRREGR